MAANSFNYKSQIPGGTQIDNSQNIPSQVTPALQNASFLYGNRRPLINVTFNGTTANGSQVITAVNTLIVAKLYVGLPISGIGVPSGSVIISLYNDTITISQAATASATVALTCTEISLPIPMPLSGYPSYSYYQTYQLPINLITSPDSLLSWFASSGYEVNFGNSGTQVLNNIVAYTPSPAVPGNVSLYFAGQSLNISSLANSVISGLCSISGTSIDASLVSITTGSYNPNVTTEFTCDTDGTTGVLTNLSINSSLLTIGSNIVGAGIPANSVIISINSSTSITIDNDTTIDATDVEVTYTSVNTVACDTVIVINSASYINLQINQNLTINYIQESGNPDINRTEPFIMNLWQASLAMTNMNGINTNATVGAPNLYFAILPNAADTNYYGPTDDNMPMGVSPSSVATALGLTTITIPITSNYASFVPFTTLGNTTITQATSNATGTVFQSVINGSNLQIQLNNVIGTFNTTNNITLQLDNTITIYNLQQTYFANYKQSLRTFPCIYEIFNATDVTNILQPLATYVQNLNLPVTANNGQGNCSVMYGNQTYTPQQALTLMPKAFNNQYYDGLYINYVQRAGVVVRSFAQSICALAAVFASNNYPFNPLNLIELAGFDNSTNQSDWIDTSIGGVADQLTQEGLSVVATNATGQYLMLGRTTQTTINGVPNTEFYPTYVMDTGNYLRLQVYQICQNNGVGQVRQNDITLKSINQALVNLQNQMGENGDRILANVVTTRNLITVTNSTQNPLGINIYFPYQQNPGLNSVYATLVNYSINYVF